MKDNKYLNAARVAKEENNYTDAKRFYEMVKMDDPENGEAKYFYAYYTILEGTKGEVKRNYGDFVNVVGTSIKAIGNSDMLDNEKAIILQEMASVAKQLPVFVLNVLNSIKEPVQLSNQKSLSMLYSFGDSIETAFSNNVSIIENIAVDMWKAAVELQCKWTAVKFDEKYIDKYSAKIQKYEPTYTPPKVNIVLKILGSILKHFG